MKKKVTVTIGREYGSGGREVGEKLAEKLGFTFLDKNILNEISGKSGISVEELMENDEKPVLSGSLSSPMILMRIP